MQNFIQSSSIHRLIREADMTVSGQFIGEEYCPMNETDFMDEVIRYDILGPVRGLTPPHELDTPAALLKPQTLKTALMDTAYWREASIIGEKDRTQRRLGATEGREALGTLVDRRVNQVVGRLASRKEQLIWSAFGTGAISATSDTGVTVSVSYGIPAGNQLNTTDELGAHWTDFANANPVADVEEAINLFSNTSAMEVHMLCNAYTSGLIMNNVNFKNRYSGHPLILEASQTGSASLLAQQVGGRLKMGRVHDGSYIADNGTFTKFIPNGRVILLGKAVAGQDPCAEFASTPHEFNGGGNGVYGTTVEMTDPPGTKVIGGLHGLPVIYQPDWVVILTVTA